MTDMAKGEWYQVAWDSRLEVDPDAEYKTSQLLEDESTGEQSTALEEGTSGSEVAARASSSQTTTPYQTPLSLDRKIQDYVPSSIIQMISSAGQTFWNNHTKTCNGGVPIGHLSTSRIQGRAWC